ncbi:prepilin-type N-terminal cleavage/methylation domain-containing protein [Luteibacter jiangsuensis]|uniref:Prepilin-type N-terminal cleavage/methylation domain-containing protein n=1 Tax=Luteibacter jiangsuensis TaxID=637577 RepID=A0ABT9SS94_9GAMM|nr:type II secretion system protein [Luteibacter jiangsuensis]MDQ0007871.1 prepilin-type N-terminal cleavage/methylation domain-containing protein [Luteibacter jiangsuensis]
MRQVSGSSLIESLVALAVFAIGSASTATWVAQSMAVDARASRLVAATTIAVSLEARIRAGGGTVSDGDLQVFHAALIRRMGPAARGSVICKPPAACAIRIAWATREVLSWPFDP